MEVACEGLRAMSAARASTEQTVTDLALYIPPLCSPTKDTPKDESNPFQELDDAVMQWLSDDENQVLLLHGQSGSGKSLYVGMPVVEVA